MIIKELEEFSQTRYKLRAYLCYIFQRNIPNFLPNPTIDLIKDGFDNISHDLVQYEIFYILDKNGNQIENNISKNPKYIVGKGLNHSLRSYYYNCISKKRCFLTDPYPSSLNNELCVTVSMPVYNDKKELQFVACTDISLQNILKLINPGSVDGIFGKISRIAYSLVVFALFCVSAILFYLGIKSLIFNSIHLIDASEMFESTILLTLSLAILDLVKAYFEEEIIGKHNIKNGENSKTMVKFISSIIIALAIEALMLVFKFAMTAPEQIVFAVFLILSVSALIISLGVYAYVVKRTQN